MTSMRRKWLCVLIGACIFFLILCCVAYFMLPSLLPEAIVYAPNAGTKIDTEQDPRHEELERLGIARHLRIDVRQPPASLSAYVINPQSVPAGTVILLHGINDRKESLLGTALELARGGYRSILLDHRGHGRSTGKYVTFGVIESIDVVQVIDRLEREGVLHPPLGLLGYSFGGAVAIQTAAKDMRVAAVVSVSTFASLRKVLGNYVATYVPIIGGLLSQKQLDEAMSRAGVIAGFDPLQADSIVAARKLQVPLLVIHGAADQKIPVAHARQIAAAAQVTQLVVVKGADHNSIMGDPSGEVWKNITAWFAAHLRPPM